MWIRSLILSYELFLSLFMFVCHCMSVCCCMSLSLCVFAASVNRTAWWKAKKQLVNITVNLGKETNVHAI